MTAQQRRREKIVAAAIVWMRGKRPRDWTPMQHLAMPEVNSTSDGDGALARAVADYLTMGGALKPKKESTATKRRGGGK